MGAWSPQDSHRYAHDLYTPLGDRVGCAHPPLLSSHHTHMEPTVPSELQAYQCTPETMTQTLLAIVQQLAIELHPHKHNGLLVTLDSALERDLGFDSLGRMELLLRLERAFGIQLPEQVLATAEVPRDLIQAVHSATSTGAVLRTATAVETAVITAVDGVPADTTTLIEVLDWHACVHPQQIGRAHV